MQAAELEAWQKRLRFSDKRAAAAIGLSLSGYRKQCGGERPVSLQTELLTRYVELFAPAWLDIATAWLDIAHGAQALARRVYPAR